MLRLINDAHFKFAYELYDCLLLENRTANGTQRTNWLWYIFRLQLPLFNGLLKSANCCAKKPVPRTTHRVTLAVGVSVITSRLAARLSPDLSISLTSHPVYARLPVWSTVPCPLSHTVPTVPAVHCPMSLATWLSASGACG